MNNIKILYKFSVPTFTEIEEKTPSTDATGAAISISKMVKTEVPKEVALKKPTAKLIDDADLFYNVTVGKGLEAGLMSRTLLAKRLSNDGGIFSKKELDTYDSSFEEYQKLSIEKGRLEAKDISEQTEEEKLFLRDASDTLSKLRAALEAFELKQYNIFNITSESRARTKTIIWWLLHLLYWKNDKGQWEAVFKGETDEAKLAFYNKIEEEEDDMSKEEHDLYIKVTRHAAAATSFWYNTGASTEEHWKLFDNELKGA